MDEAKVRAPWNVDGAWEFGDVPSSPFDFITENMDALWDSIRENLDVAVHVDAKGDLDVHIYLLGLLHGEGVERSYTIGGNDDPNKVSRAETLASWIGEQTDEEMEDVSVGDVEGVKHLIVALQRWVDGQPANG